MKKSYIILLLIFIWIGFSVGAIVIINNYINDKDTRLRCEIRDKIENLFQGQDNGEPFIGFDYGFFDSDLSNGYVRNFKKAQVPAKPKKSDFSESILSIDPKAYDSALERWNADYGDVSSLWDLNWGSHDYREADDEGWRIVGIRSHGTDESLIHTFVLFPYRVALKRTEWGNYYTVPQAVDEAFEFYTTDPKSGISDRYSKGPIRRLWNRIYDCNNEYYGVYKNDNEHSWYEGRSIPGASSASEGGPIENGWMHNGYYRVYIAVSQETHYGIFKHSWNPDIQERNKLLLWWLIGISVIFLTPIIILSLKIRKVNKYNDEALKDRLARLSNPASFMKPYNKELVDKANIIYPKIINCSSDEELISLADIVQSELGIGLVTTNEINEALNIANPSNYIKPYNAEKVALANDLYSKLQIPNLKYSEFIAIKEQLKQLISEQ